MASVYKKGNKWYLSWYDSTVGKTFNYSTGLNSTKENYKIAKLMADEFQSKYNAEREKHKAIGLLKKTIYSSFQNFLEINSNKNNMTIIGYKWFFKKFTETFPAESHCGIINKISVEKWLVKLKKENNLSQNTLHNYCKILRKYLSFLFEYNYLIPFKINSNVIIKPEVKPIITFSNDDINKIISGLEDEYNNGVKKKNSNFVTLIYTLIYTGLRPSDIIGITCEDIDIENKRLQYYSVKTNEYFIIPIHESLLPILSNRINEIKSGRIFNYKNINHMGRAFRRYLKTLGLTNKNYNLRTFRKSFISMAYASGVDLTMVSKLVGHKQITTTAKYYNKISISHQSNEVNKIKFPI
jgi:integrase